MKKYIIDEKTGLKYELIGDYYYPCLEAPEAPRVGRFGMMYHDYLRNHKRVTYSGLMLSGKLKEQIEEVGACVFRVINFVCACCIAVILHCRVAHAVNAVLRNNSSRFVVPVVIQIGGFESGERKLDDIEKELTSSPDYNPPDPPALMTAKTYKAKFVDPVIKALKELVKTILVKFFQIRSEYSRVLDNNGRLWREGENLRYEVDRLREENKDLRHVNSELRKRNKDHTLLRKVFGSEQIDHMILQAKQLDEQKRNKKKGRDAR